MLLFSFKKWNLQAVFCLLFLFITPSLSYGQQGSQIYQTYCAGCHGADLQGESATALIKTNWIYGRGRNAIIRNITYGIPSTDMAAWHTALSNLEIEAVADFIIASQQTPPDAIRPVPATLTTQDYQLKVEELVKEGLSTPWAIEFVDTLRALISERDGSLRWLSGNSLDKNPIQGLPSTFAQKTGGFMDIALHPDYQTNGWVYLAFSHTKENPQHEEAAAMTKIIRGRINGYQWTDEQTLFQVPDSLMVINGNRWGCRLLFDKAGFLYFTIGDMAQALASQDVSKAPGKIFRILPDGSIPEDNPFIHVEGALPSVYTIGNRNVQGLAQHPETGEIWVTEHGPMGGDELNIITKGANYGWPLITYGIDYSGEIVSEKKQMAGMVQPVTYWNPSIAVCPAEFSTSPMFGKWKNNLLIGALAFEEIRRLVIDKQQVKAQEIILKGVGRVRDIKTAPDGSLYVVLNNPDKILRITVPDQP